MRMPNQQQEITYSLAEPETGLYVDLEHLKHMLKLQHSQLVGPVQSSIRPAGQSFYSS